MLRHRCCSVGREGFWQINQTFVFAKDAGLVALDLPYR